MSRITNAYNLTIASGASLSNSVQIKRQEVVVALMFPTLWTAAPVTLQASFDTTLRNVYKDGSEFTRSGAGASQYNVLDPALLIGANWIAVRSGNLGAAVAQADVRTLVLITAEL